MSLNVNEGERSDPCACTNQQWGFFTRDGKGYAQCRKCGAYWVFEVGTPRAGHPDHPPVHGGYRGDALAEHDTGVARSRSSVIAEAMLADAVRVEAPAFPPRQADGTINPKDAAALKRVPMHLLPQVGVVYGAMACRDGAIKYGPYNWRERSISLTQYVGAIQRHCSALLDGEDNAQDSELPHLAHVIATAAILLDAQQAGALLDDRPKRSGNTAGLIADLNARLAAKEGA